MLAESEGVVWVQVYAAVNDLSANVVLQAMHEAGIPSVQVSRPRTAMDIELGFTLPGVCTSSVMVPEDRLTEALVVMSLHSITA